MAKDYKREYSEKLKDPRWQQKRLGILNRDNWTCQECFDTKSTLHVHHLKYEKKTEPWEYPDFYLITLCETCHYNVEKYRPVLENDIMDSLKLRVKDEFMLRCLSEVITSAQDFERLIFLIWENGSHDIMKALEGEHKKKLQEGPTLGGVPNCKGECVACGSKHSKNFPKYKYNVCSVCGFSLSYEE